MAVRKKSGERGFTLIELLVVIAVIGILAGITVPRLIGVIDKAEDAKITSAAGIISTAMEIYYVENSNAYPDISNWTELAAALVDSADLKDKSFYNIASIRYGFDNNNDYYLIEFTSSKTGNTYYLGEKGYNETNDANQASAINTSALTVTVS